jgi:hypothetical protein
VKQTDPPVKPPVNKDRISADALTRLKKSTVYIEVEDGNGGGGSGTGWFGAEPGLVITNAHVIGMITPGTKEPAKITIYTDSGEKGQQKQYEGQKVKVLAVDRDMDLAVLQIINEKDLPPPLPIRPAAQTQQLDKLVCLGFPGGRRLADRNRSTDPPTITVTETTLSAYRNDDGGNLYSVQIQGGVVHGNSGGPVADLDGNVIGVAVRVDLDSSGRFTNIAYAVPGEYVTGLLTGRAAEGIIRQGYVQGDRVVYPVIVKCADAMNRLKSVGVAVWVGEKGPRRPAGDKHQQEKGDVGYREVPLVYDKVKKVAVGTIDFPRNSDGRAYWAQPFYSNAATAKRYLAGSALPDGEPPVEQTAIDLSPRHPIGTEHKLTVVHALKVNERLERGGVEAIDRRVVAQEFRAKELVEKPKTASAHAQLDLVTVGDAVKMEVTSLGDKPSLPKDLMEAKEALTRWNGLLAVGRDGKVSGTTLGPLGLSVTDKAKKDVATRLAQQWADSAAEAHIKLPGKVVKAGDTWTDSYPHKFKLREELLTSEPAGRTAVIGTVKEEVTFTYIGRRDRAGRGEAVLFVEGLLRPVGVEGATCGSVIGRAILDERTGMVIDMDLQRDFDLDVKVGETVIEAVGVEKMKVTREK